MKARLTALLCLLCTLWSISGCAANAPAEPAKALHEEASVSAAGSRPASDGALSAPADYGKELAPYITVPPGYAAVDSAAFSGSLYSGAVFFFRSETDEEDLQWLIPVFREGQFLEVLSIRAEEHGGAFPPAGNLVRELDADFDGQPDLLLGLGHFGAQGALRHKCYLTRDDHLELCPSFSEILNPALDPACQAVLSSWRNNAVSHGYGVWRFQDGAFVMTERLTEAPAPDSPLDDLIWTWTEETLEKDIWKIQNFYSAAVYNSDAIEALIYGPQSHWGIMEPRWNRLIGLDGAWNDRESAANSP